MIAVDSSVLIDLLRGRETVATRTLARLEQDAIPYAIPDVCLQEVLQGARDESEWAALEGVLGTQRLLTTDDARATRIAAARIYYVCRRAGITVRSTADCFIAQLCIEHDAPLLHDDADFTRIATIVPLRCLGGGL